MEGNIDVVSNNPRRQILIATDGSETANEAADFAMEMFGCSGAKVYAVYVIDTTPYRSIPLDKIWSKETLDELERAGLEATSYVEKIGKAAGSWQTSFDPQISEWGNPLRKEYP